MEELRRLIELVSRELRAVQVRIELFGPERNGPREVFVRTSDTVAIVAELAEDPGDKVRARLTAKLAELAGGFASTIEDAARQAAEGPAARQLDPAELKLALQALRERAGASSVAIVDERSPEIWGADPPLPWRRLRPGDETDDPVAGPMRRAIEAVREGETPDADVYVTPLLGLYRLVIVGLAAGELRVEGVVRRARPVLERLLRSLPPREPRPTRAVVVPLRD